MPVSIKKLCMGVIIMVSLFSGTTDAAELLISEFGDEELYAVEIGDSELQSMASQTTPIAPTSPMYQTKVRFDIVNLGIINISESNMTVSFLLKNMGYLRNIEVIYIYNVTDSDSGDNHKYYWERLILDQEELIIRNLIMDKDLEQNHNYTLIVYSIWVDDRDYFTQAGMDFIYLGEDDYITTNVFLRQFSKEDQPEYIITIFLGLLVVSIVILMLFLLKSKRKRPTPRQRN